MRVFVCGDELGLAFVIARRLLEEGHKVNLLTGFENLIPNLTKNGMNPVLGGIRDGVPQKALAKADAVIDAKLPGTFPRKRVHVSRLRPMLLKNALAGSGRLLIMTSDAAVLGDTGPQPVTESARLHPLKGFAWLPRLERAILPTRNLDVVVIRPAWWVHGRGYPLSVLIGNWMTLARRFRRGKYIDTGENCCSAVALEDLAELYCLALRKARPRMLLHAASENVSMRELAATIHRGMGFKGNPSSLSSEQAKRFTPHVAALTRSHALSSAAARNLGWQPSHDSILKTVEREASVHAWAWRQRFPATECRDP
jgi:nucleoside-diphosphate-sugar epimerase